MIIMGNSVPPPSIRCTLVIWGHANGPNSWSSQVSAVWVRSTAMPPPQRLLVAGLVEHMDGDVAEVPALVAVVGVERHGEVVHVVPRTSGSASGRARRRAAAADGVLAP